MSNLIRHLYAQVERRAVWILGIGIALAFVWNWRLWLRDRQQVARLQQEKQKAHNTEGIREPAPQVSILLPAWNEVQNIDACLQSLLKLRYPNKQLIICAGGFDGTLQNARRYESDQVIVLKQKDGEGKQRALRLCYQYAAGEIIFLTDADCIVDDETFERTIEPILSGQEQAVTGAWRPVDRQLSLPFVQYQWAHHTYREVWMPDYAPALDGKNAAVCIEALDDVGSFDLEAPIGTDYVLSKQLEAGGYPIRLARQSRVQTEYPENVADYWKQQSRWFRNWFLLSRQWGEPVSFLSLIRATLPGAFLLVLPIVGGFGSRFLWAIWLVTVCHLALASRRFADVLWMSKGRTKPQNAWLFVVYVPLGWIAALIGLLDSMLPFRARRW